MDRQCPQPDAKVKDRVCTDDRARIMKFALVISATVTIAIMAIGSPAADEMLPAGSGSPDFSEELTREPDISQPSIAVRRAAAREHLARLNDEKRYDEAVGVALQILRLTQEEFGEDAPEVIDPLLDLAITQRNSADLPTAALNLSTAVALIEKHHGPLSAELIVPLTMLGEIYNESTQYDKATDVFDKALRLNHVNHGFTNFDQFPIMDGLTASYTSQSDFQEATFYQEAQLEIQQRRLGIDNAETAPAYYKLARWYSDIYLYEEAVLAYQKADRIVRTAYGKDSPERAEGLRGKALVYQKRGDHQGSRRTLRMALQLIEKSPDSDDLQRASILIALGDSLTREGKFSTAEDQYTAAWQTLPDNEAGDERRKFYFDKSVRLEGGLYPRYARKARGRSADELSTGSVLIDYTIDIRGRVIDASVIESNPQGLMDRSFLSIYRQSLYRPHYADGVARLSDNRRAEHTFLYIDSEVKNDDDSDAPAKSNQKRGKLSYPGDD